MNRAHLPLNIGSTVLIKASGHEGTIQCYRKDPDMITGFWYYVRDHELPRTEPWLALSRDSIQANREGEYDRYGRRG